MLVQYARDLFVEPLPEGEVYLKVFICHGCQTCLRLNPDVDEGPDSVIRSYPHFLSPFEDVTQKVLGS